MLRVGKTPEGFTMDCQNKKPGLGHILPCQTGKPAVVEVEMESLSDVPPILHLCLDCASRLEEQGEEHGYHAKWVKVTPEAGMPCTFIIGSDRRPGKVLSVNGRTIVVQRVQFKPGEGHDYYGSQKWDILDEPEGGPEVYTLRSNGRWARKGDSMKYANLVLGYAQAYHDPHF